MAYNPTKQHAYNLPAHKTRSYWKDQTHKGEGFNEIRFESERGKEEIFVHAQRDMNSSTGRNQLSQVGGDSHCQIFGNNSQLVFGDSFEHSKGITAVSSSNSISIASGANSPINGINPEYFHKAGNNSSGKNVLLKNYNSVSGGQPGSLQLHSASDTLITADASMNIQSDLSMRISTHQSFSIKSSEVIKVHSKDATLLSGEGGVAISSNAGIVIKSGKSKITLDPDGNINISGVLIKINGQKICLN